MPAGPINTVADAFADPQTIARAMQQVFTLPGGQEIAGVRSPMKFGRMTLKLGSASPQLGADD